MVDTIFSTFENLKEITRISNLNIFHITEYVKKMHGQEKKIILKNPLKQFSFGWSFQGSCVSILCHARTLHVTLFVDYVITPGGVALRDVNAEVLLCTCSR